MKKDSTERGTKPSVRRDIALFGNMRVMTCAGLLAALSIVLGKFLQIPNPFQDIIRISFENTPLIMSGIFFGPCVGLVTGAVADLLGCALYGYSVNPLVTLGAASVGFVAGIISNYIIRRGLLIKTVSAVLFSHVIGSVVIKSVGLAAWYLSTYNMGLTELMLWRLLTYAIIGAAETVIIYALLRNRGFSSQLERMVRKK